MKKTLSNGWHALGFAGRVFVACFLFYFITKTMKH